MMFSFKKYLLCYFACLILSVTFAPAQTPNDPIYQINTAISNNNLDEAESLIQKALKQSGEKNINWNEGDLVYAIGKIEFLRNRSTSFERSQDFLHQLITRSKPDSVLYRAYLNTGLLFDEQGNNAASISPIQKASKIALKLNDPYKLVETEYYLAQMYLKTGDFNKLISHTNNALHLLNSHKELKHPLAPRIYNYKASVMHFLAQDDSANFYFEKALESIPNMNETPENLYYLPGTIYGNWFLVKQSAGDFDAAMDMTLKCIKCYKDFLSQAPNDPLTQQVYNNLSIAYRNLGSLYNDLGYKEKAIQVSTLGYVNAKKHFLPNTISYFSAVLMMGEAYLYSNQLDKARTYLNEAENSLKQVPGDNFFYYANFYGVMANLENHADNLDKAIDYYQKSSYYQLKSDEQEFSQNYIYNEINLAQTYADNGEPNKASELITKILSETKKDYGNESFLANAVRTSQARIEFSNGNYQQTVETCNQIINILSNKYGLSDLNNLYYHLDYAEILRLKAQSNYKLLKNKDSINSFTPILNDIDRAIKQLEKQKSIITSREEVADLIEDNNLIFDFAKKINLELYQKTQNATYLKKLIELHESSIYNRIRARLNLNENELSLVPKNITNREKELKRRLNSFFATDDDTEIDIDSLKLADKNWNTFLTSLNQQYPKYYNLRYASIIQDLGNLKNNLPDQTTIVRYLFIDKKLYAYVLNKQEENLYALNYSENRNRIQLFKDFTSSEDTISNVAYEMYQELWKPFEDKVTTPNVIIFPDDELFNFAFELLTPNKINTLNELSEKSLLAKYNISYNYSLLLLNNNQKAFDFNQDFIAFAPGFSDTMKIDYQQIISDSLNLDKAYLRLLPQPFTEQLVKQMGKSYNGQSFLNENASKQLFINRAREHKIIHIGTHAESDNLNPELSRLVFAKNLTDTLSLNDNYLYNYEIYNLDLSSDLAILTACETGKPGYQPGEGMISLAHAFNYAGSESILTSLWEIDEKSSVEILKYFYRFLKDGKRKDEALRLAKLEYIKNAKGRTIHPQYWAGLILMGNTNPIKFSESFSRKFWIPITLVIVIVFLFYFRKRIFKNRIRLKN